MTALSRRSLLVAVAASALTVALPGPAWAQSTTSNMERTIARALRSAALRKQMTPAASHDLATKLGVHLGSSAPRSTPWLKALAKASPVGRVITIVGTVALAYDVVSDMWNAAPSETASKEAWDGAAGNCADGQICTFKDSGGTTFAVVTTYEKTTTQSTWTHWNQPGYSVLKNVSLGSSNPPYLYKVWWRFNPIEIPLHTDPRPTTRPDGTTVPKQKVAPGDLADYLRQFAEAQPDPVGFAKTINDVLDKMDTVTANVTKGVRLSARDIADAVAGVGTKIRDALKDTPFDRDPRFDVNDEGEVVPAPDPNATPTPSPTPSPGTGTGTGSGTCLPGSASCPAVIELSLIHI